MRINEAGDNRASLQINHASAGTSSLSDVGRSPHRQNLTVMYCEGFADRKPIVNGEDFSVHEDCVGRLRQCRQNEHQCNKDCEGKASHSKRQTTPNWPVGPAKSQFTWGETLAQRLLPL